MSTRVIKTTCNRTVVAIISLHSLMGAFVQVYAAEAPDPQTSTHQHAAAKLETIVNMIAVLGKDLPDYEEVLGRPDKVEDKGPALGSDEHATLNHFQLAGGITVIILYDPERAPIFGVGRPLLGPPISAVDVMFAPDVAANFTQALALMGLKSKGIHVITGTNGAAETDYFLDGGKYYAMGSAAWHAKWTPHNSKRSTDLLTFEWRGGVAVSKSAAQALAEEARQDSQPIDRPQPAVKASGIIIISDRDAELSDAMSATDVAGAREKEAQVIRFTGVVTGVRLNADRSATRIEFAKTGHPAILAYILKPNLSNFPSPGKLLGKMVLIRGDVYTTGGQPGVELTEPGQIKIVSADTAP